MLEIDGFDGALIGKAEIWVPSGAGASYVDKLVYDGEKIVAILMAQGMSEEDAREYVSFNIEGAYMGIGTPIIVWPYHEH
jgi:hypothetical protein